MKCILYAVLAGILWVGFLGSSAWAQARVATIDLTRTVDNYWKTKQAQAVLKEREADMDKEYKNMIEDRKKAKEVYDKLVVEASDPAISTEERDKRKRSAEEKLRYLRELEETMAQYQRQARVTLEEQLRRFRESIHGEIRAIVNAKAKLAGYSLVVDTSAESIRQTPIILFSSNDNDITQDVLKELNATAPPDTLKTEEKKEEKK